MALKPKSAAKAKIVTGTLAADTLSGLSGHTNTVYGLAGNDTISGANLADELYGGAGDDLIVSGAGDDTISGDTGRDIIRAGDGNDLVFALNDGDTIDGGAGIDTVSYYNVFAGVSVALGAGSENPADWSPIDRITNVENLIGSRFDDRLHGDLLPNVIHGMQGNDLVAGEGGADTLYGGGGNDILVGDGSTLSTQPPGNDVLYGDAGNDTIYGMEGRDSLYGGTGDDLLVGGAGADLLHGGTGIDTAEYSEGFTGIEVNLATGRGKKGLAEGDVLVGIENVTGSQSDDLLVGDDLANLLAGISGDDTLIGGGGKDSLIGGAGHDVLIGGLGADQLWGHEPGAPESNTRDVFKYVSAADSTFLAMDTIHDFRQGRGIHGDVVALDFDANTRIAGKQKFSFIGENEFSGKAGELRFYWQNGDTFVVADTNADRNADFFIRLKGLHEMTAADFLL